MTLTSSSASSTPGVSYTSSNNNGKTGAGSQPASFIEGLPAPGFDRLARAAAAVAVITARNRMREIFTLWRNAVAVVVASPLLLDSLSLEIKWGDLALTFENERNAKMSEEEREAERIAYEREAAEWEAMRIERETNLKAEYEIKAQREYETVCLRMRPKFMRMVEDDYLYHGVLLWDPITLLEAELTWCPHEQLRFYRWGSSHSSYWEHCTQSECKHLHRSDIYCREHACTSNMVYAQREAHCEDLHDSISIEEKDVCNCFPCESNELWTEVPDWRYFGLIKERVLMSELEITALGISDGFCGVKPAHGFKPRCAFLHHELHDGKIFCRAHVVDNCSTCGDFDGWTRFSIDMDGDMTIWPRWYLHRPRGQAAGQDAVHISDLERRGFKIEVPHDMRIPHPHGYFVKWEFCGQFWAAAMVAEKQDVWRQQQKRKSTGWRS